MASLYPVDPSAQRGVSIPLPDGSSFDTAGALAPDAAAMAQEAGIVPKFIMDPLDKIRAELGAWVQSLQQQANPTPASVPTHLEQEPGVDIEGLNAQMVADSPLPALRSMAQSGLNPLNHLSLEAGLGKARGAFDAAVDQVPADVPTHLEAEPGVDIGAANEAAKSDPTVEALRRLGNIPAWTPPNVDISAYDRGMGGAVPGTGTGPAGMAGFISDEQAQKIMELEQRRAADAAARRQAAIEFMGGGVVPFEQAFGAFTGAPAAPTPFDTGSDRGTTARRGGAFDEDEAAPAADETPAPQGALAAETGPGQAQGAPPAAASGGAGVPPAGSAAAAPAPASAPGVLPGEDRGTAAQTGTQPTLVSQDGGEAFDPVKLFDQLAERFRDADESTDLDDEERKDLMIEAGLRMLSAASRPGASAFGAAGEAGAAAIAGKRRLKSEKKALNLERQKQGLDLAKTVTGLAMDAAKLENERAKMGYDASHDLAVLEEQRRHNQASEAFQQTMAQAALVRAARVGDADRQEANNNYRLTLSTLYERANNRQFSGLPALAATDEDGNPLETEEEAIQRIAAYQNPDADAARAWAQGAIFREQQLQSRIKNSLEFTSEQKDAEIEASQQRIAQLWYDFLE